MQFWIWRYTLKPRRRLSALAAPGAREGALLRAGDGFADIHPWPELGDAPLDEQLKRVETLPAMHYARIDGEARRRGVSLFDGLTIPESHWPGGDPPDGFDTVKLKGDSAGFAVPRVLGSSVPHPRGTEEPRNRGTLTSIPPDVRLRIDFNATLTPDEFARIAATLPRERVDFIEDPCPDLSELRTDLRIARDRAHGPADVLIHKPALSTEFPTFDGEIVVTSYMDHPVGQFHAAYVAATHDVSARCGLFTHVLYESNEFIEAIRTDGARLLPPEGTGIGFDDLLERLPWQRL